MINLYDLMDRFHDASDESRRNSVRFQMRQAGFNGVADTILPVSEGGTDWRVEHTREVAEINRRAQDD